MNPLSANSGCLLSKHTYPRPSRHSLHQDFWRRGCFNICKELLFGPLMQLLRVGGVYLHMQPQCTPFSSLNHHCQSSEMQPGVPLPCWMQESPPVGHVQTHSMRRTPFPPSSAPWLSVGLCLCSNCVLGPSETGVPSDPTGNSPDPGAR